MTEKIKYPLSIQNFSKLREGGYLYFDKTELIYQLVQETYAYFLARPRRFGKSLLVSTLEELFQGKRDLFKGLWIDSSDYKWPVHPVIRLDFTELQSDTLENLNSTLHTLLDGVAKKYDLQDVEDPLPAVRFSKIIRALSEINSVVILIDEYDRPCVGHLNRPETLKRNRDFLGDFFVRIKSMGECIQFALITGVSKFSQVSLFSELNNLVDISSDQQYASLLGITEVELHSYLVSEVDRVATFRNETAEQTFQLIKKWYNGYAFSRLPHADKVYNPLSLMKFLRSGELDNFWFSTATPTFAIELIKNREYPVQDFENGVIAGKEIELSFQEDRIDLNTLLFQTGYLTIDTYEESEQLYHLKFPNEEVRRSFLYHLLNAFSQLNPSQMQASVAKLSACLRDQDVDRFFSVFNEVLAVVPHHIHINAEAYYHSLIYLLLRALGFRVQAEVVTSRGRIDMLLEMKEAIYVFEFKINNSAQGALDQILDREYHKQFLSDSRDLILVGANFDSGLRSLNDWIIQQVEK